MPYDFQSLLENLASANPQAAAAINQRKQIAETLRERLFNEGISQQQLGLSQAASQRAQDEFNYRKQRDTIADQQYNAQLAQTQAQKDQASHNQYLSGAASGDLMEVTPPSQASQALGSQLGPQATQQSGATVPSNPSSTGNASGTPSAIGPRASINPNPQQSSPDVLSMLMFPNQPNNPISAGPTVPTPNTGAMGGGATAPTFNANDFYQDPVTKRYYRPTTPQEKSATQLASKKQTFTDFMSDPVNKPLTSDPDQVAAIHNHMVYGLPIEQNTMDKLEASSYKTLASSNATPEAKQAARTNLNNIQRDKLALKAAERPPVDPNDMEATAQAIAHYQQAPMVQRSPNATSMALQRRIQEINPDYSPIKYNDFNKTESTTARSMAQGPISSLNTTYGHLDLLADAAKALQNGDVQLLNRVANVLGVQTGQDKVTTYKTIVHRVAPEITQAYVGAGGSLQDRIQNESDFDPALGGKQITSNIRATAQLLDSKLKQQQRAYDQGTYGQGKLQVFDPANEPIRQRLTTLGQQRPTITGPGGKKLQLSDDGTSWVPATK